MWVNLHCGSDRKSFGGYKKSGIGRDPHKVTLDLYTQMKNIYINQRKQTGPTEFL